MRRRLGALNYSGSDLPVVISVIIGLGFVLNQGPHFQTLVISILTSDQASIYGSVHGDGIVEYPALGEWIFLQYDAWFLLVALFAVLYAVQTRFAKKLFIDFAVAVALLMTLLDVSRGVIYGGLTAQFVVENIVSNLVGALIMACIFLLMLAASRWARMALRSHSRLAFWAPLFLPVLIGLLVGCLMFYGSTLLLNPSMASFEAKVSPPTSGFTIPPKNASEKDAFDFFDHAVQTAANVSWTGSSESLALEWRRESDRRGYRVDIYGIEGCASGNGVEELVRGGSAIHSFDDVGEIGLSMSDGPSDFLLIPLSIKGAHVQFKEDGPSMYWLSEGKKERSLSLSLFSDAASELSFWSHSEPLLLYFSGPLLDVSGQKPKTRSLQASFAVDGVEHRIEFKPKEKYLEEDPIGCSLLDRSPVMSGTYVHENAEIYAGVAIRLTPPRSGRDILDERVDKVRVTGVGGWLTVKDAPRKDVLRIISPGILYGFAAHSGLEEFYAHGERYQVGRDDSIQATDGSIRVALDSSGSLFVSGQARAIYLSGSRANKTRWEQIDWSGRAVLLAIFPLAGAFFWRVLARLLRENERLLSSASFIRRPRGG